MRFLDRFYKHGLYVDNHSIFGCVGDAETKFKYDELHDEMCASVNFDIQNVDDMLEAQSLSGWEESSFAPPFKNMILEYKHSDINEVAIFAHCQDLHKMYADPVLRQAAQARWWRAIASGDDHLQVSEQARWLISLHLMIREAGALTFRACVARSSFMLDDVGRMLTPKHAQTGEQLFITWISDLIVEGAALPGDDAEMAGQTAGQLVQSIVIAPFLATNALLNTKGITTRDVFPARQQRREAARRNVPSPVNFRVLTVKAPGYDLGSPERRVNGSALSDAPLHIVRGHIARYGEQYGRKKLFGRYEGQYFIPAHIRGSAEAGMIGKDYIVEAPKRKAA